MDDSNGPTAAIEGRRFRATRMMLTISQRAGRAVARTFSINRTLDNQVPIKRARPEGGKSDNPRMYLKIK
jgi:hypothetical protein